MRYYAESQTVLVIGSLNMNRGKLKNGMKFEGISMRTRGTLFEAAKMKIQ